MTIILYMKLSHVLIFLVSIYNVLVSPSDIKAAILYHIPVNCIISNTVCVCIVRTVISQEANLKFQFTQLKIIKSHIHPLKG